MFDPKKKFTWSRCQQHNGQSLAAKVPELIDDVAQKLFKRQQDLSGILLGEANQKQ